MKLTPQRLHAELPIYRKIIQSELQRELKTAISRIKHMYSKEIENQKKRLKLTKRQKEILVGKILGDGHLETQDNGKTYRLKVEHSIKQKVYVDWLYNEFKEWVRTFPQSRKREVKLRTVSGEYEKYWFNTLSSGSLRFYAKEFYRDGKKIVPELIHRWLSPLAIAVWYMDDGSIKSRFHKTVLLNTHSFSKISLKRLQKVLLDRYVVKTTLQKQREGIQIYIISETIDKFLNIIEPHILPSMRYKLPEVWLTQLPKK